MNIDSYIASRTNAWSATTLASERHRLNAVASLLDGNPERLWAGIQHLGAYSRLTTWTRVTDYWSWAKPDEPNPYASWRRANAKVFKYVYQKKKPGLTFEEAWRLCESLPKAAKEKAQQLLTSGLRYGESTTAANGRVVGKGGKVRATFGLPSGPNDISYQTFRRQLARVGLKPHDLRKIFLSRLVEKGANEFELCEIAGWSSIATASSYIAVNKSRLASLVADATKV